MVCIFRKSTSGLIGPLESWHHGERVDPATWPWWIFCRFSHVRVDSMNNDVRHKLIGQVGRCAVKACQPETNPEHFENCRPRVYSRFYCYTRTRAYDIDVRIE